MSMHTVIFFTPASAAPVIAVAPAITGVHTVGSLLSCSTGTWNNVPTSFAYAWKRNGTPIGGATNPTYTAVTADIGQSIKCTVTATNAIGSTPADSNTITDITGLPVNTVAPAITGSHGVGQTLTCDDGTWTGGGSFSYGKQWKRNGANIGGATASTYVAQAADVGASIKCTVTATNPAGATPADSNTITDIVSVPVNSVAPTISGGTTAGSTLTVADPGTWTQTPTSYTYQWQADGVDIGGATAITYDTLIGQVGETITCNVSAHNAAVAVGGPAASNGIVVSAPAAMATWDPALPGGGTLSNGDKTVTFGATLNPTKATSPQTTGIYYTEHVYAGLTDQAYIGVIDTTIAITNNTLGEFGGEVCLFNQAGTGVVYRNGSAVGFGAAVPTFVAGDVVSVIADFTTGFVTWVRNGDTAGAYTRAMGQTVNSQVLACSPNTGAGAGGGFVSNFGQSAFAYPSLPAFYGATAGWPP